MNPLPPSSLQALSSILGDSRTGLDADDLRKLCLELGIQVLPADHRQAPVQWLFRWFTAAQAESEGPERVVSFVRAAVRTLRVRSTENRSALAENACRIVLAANGLALDQ